MRLLLLCAVAATLMLATPRPADALMTPAYMDGDGTGSVYGAFYVCTPNRCGWWFCWPDEPCYPI